MRTFHRLAFDENVDGTTAVYTNPALEPLLGLTDALSISGYAAGTSGTTPTVTVQIEQSPDRRHWTVRNATAEVNGTSLSTSAETTFQGNDGSPLGATRPGFARLKITLGGTSPKTRLKIWVTGRGEQTM